MPIKLQSADKPNSKGRPKIIGYVSVFLDFFKGKLPLTITFTQLCYRRRRNQILKVSKPLYSKVTPLSEMTGLPRTTVLRSMLELRRMGVLQKDVGKEIIFTEKGEKLYSLFLMATNKVKAFHRK